MVIVRVRDIETGPGDRNKGREMNGKCVKNWSTQESDAESGM